MADLVTQERSIREERATLWAGMTPLIEKNGRGERLTVEERTDYDAKDKRLTELDADLQTNLSMQKRQSAEAGSREVPDSRGVKGDEKAERSQREMEAFNKWFVGGEGALTPEDRSLLVPQAQGRSLNEERTGPAGDGAPLQVSPLAVSITGGSAGGYLIPPAFWENLQVAMKAYGGVYPHFRQVDTDTGAPMSWPTTDPTTLVASLLTENTQVTPQDVTFGMGQLLAYAYVAGPFLASIQLMNDSAFSVDGFVRDRISEAIGRSQAAAAWSGTGSSQPLGLSAALAAKGISGTAGAPTPGTGGILVQSTTPTTLNTFAGTGIDEYVAGAMSFQTVFNLISVVDPAYRGVSNAGPSATTGNPAWYMSDTTLQNQRQVTDLYGRPLIQQSVNVGGNTLGDTLAGYPVVIDNNAPVIAGHSTPSAANASGPVFGSLNHAMVARNVRQAGVMRLNERYADYLAVAWLGYMRYDIRSNDMKAVAQVSYAS